MIGAWVWAVHLRLWKSRLHQGGGKSYKYGNEYTKTGIMSPKFHCHLIDAQGLWNLGDYETVAPVTAEQVTDTIQRAREYLLAAEGFLNAGET